MATATKLKLSTMLGNYPITKALKAGAVRSDLVDLDFVEVKVANNLFKQVVRDARYDVAELAIVTYLQAKAFGKLGDVVSGIAHDLLEQIVCDLHLCKIEINQVRANGTALERRSDRIVAQHRVQLELCCSCHESAPG